MLDIRTLLWCFVFVSAFMAMALLLYRTKQKTYPGYDQWTSGTILLTSGYLLYVLRGGTVPLWVSIIFANAATLGGAVLRLDGLGRFIGSARISRAWYLLPPLLALICGYFHFIVDNIGVRTLFITLLLCLTLFRMATLLIAASQGGKNSLLLTIGMLHLIWGVTLAGRFLSMAGLHEWNMFNPFASNVTFFALGLTLEIGISLSFFMMQSQRLEQDLRLSHEELRQSNDQLEQKIAEIKVLSGILPICMHCKKIRDGGDWLQMELYVRRRTDAEFSHGVCPECMKSIYPHMHQSLTETAGSTAERILLDPHANGTGTIP
jgi:hypothetical protein